MPNKKSSSPIEFSELFVDFINYLISLGYGEDRSSFITGVIQRAFFDEWVAFLAELKKEMSPFDVVKQEVFDNE